MSQIKLKGSFINGLIFGLSLVFGSTLAVVFITGMLYLALNTHYLDNILR